MREGTCGRKVSELQQRTRQHERAESGRDVNHAMLILGREGRLQHRLLECLVVSKRRCRQVERAAKLAADLHSDNFSLRPLLFQRGAQTLRHAPRNA